MASPNILTIPGVQGNFYGGKPYDISFDLNFSEEPSELVIKVINENSSYRKPDLTNSLSQPQIISVDGFSFIGHLISYKNNKTVSVKDLELTYVDCSKILDCIFVGLHKRHGINTDQNYYQPTSTKVPNVLENPNFVQNNMIIVGRELHPCDTNGNGVFDAQDKELLVDWCDPCPNCPPKKYEGACQEMNDYKIFQVKYQFKDLLAKIGVSVNFDFGLLYRDYTGTLRSVLQQWCADYGLTFYWDFSKSSISTALHFVDLNKPINVANPPNDCTITEILEGESVEHSQSHGVVTYFEQQGEIKTYPCATSRIYNLYPLKYGDLIDLNKYDDAAKWISWFEMSIALSYYSYALRDCFWWFYARKITNREEARKWELKESVQTPAYIYNKTLPEFGGMVIRKVIGFEQSDEWNACNKILQQAGQLEDYQSRSEQLRGKEGSKTNPSYYFVVVDVNQEMMTRRNEYDNRLARDFLGRYWVRSVTPNLCGSSTYDSDIKVYAPDANNAKFCKRIENDVAQQIFTFGHERHSHIDEFLDNVKKDKHGKEIKQKIDIGNDVEIEGDLTQSFILAERSPKWYPNENNIADYKETLDYYESLAWKFVGEDGKPPELASIYPELKEVKDKDGNVIKNPNTRLMVVQEIDKELPITITHIPNFLEPDEAGSIKVRSDSGYLVDPNTNESILGQYGLKDNDTLWVTFDGFQFMTPVGAFMALGNPPDEIGTNKRFTDSRRYLLDDGIYSVLVSQGFSTPVYIPKVQTAVVDVPNETNIMSLEVNSVNISSEDLRTFLAGQFCTPNNAAIQQYHKGVNKHMRIVNNTPIKTLEYKQVGTPKFIPSPQNGLNSVTINVNDDGVFTSFSLSDKILATPSNDIIRLRNLYNNLNNIQQGASRPLSVNKDGRNFSASAMPTEY